MPHGACCHAKAGTAERKAYMTILIKNGHVVDPLTRIDGDYDVLIEDNRIKKVAAMIEEAARAGHRCEGLLCHAGVHRLACALQRSGPGI